MVVGVSDNDLNVNVGVHFTISGSKTPVYLRLVSVDNIGNRSKPDCPPLLELQGATCTGPFVPLASPSNGLEAYAFLASKPYLNTGYSNDTLKVWLIRVCADAIAADSRTCFKRVAYIITEARKSDNPVVKAPLALCEVGHLHEIHTRNCLWIAARYHAHIKALSE